MPIIININCGACVAVTTIKPSPSSGASMAVAIIKPSSSLSTNRSTHTRARAPPARKQDASAPACARACVWTPHTLRLTTTTPMKETKNDERFTHRLEKTTDAASPRRPKKAPAQTAGQEGPKRAQRRAQERENPRESPREGHLSKREGGEEGRGGAACYLRHGNSTPLPDGKNPRKTSRKTLHFTTHFTTLSTLYQYVIRRLCFSFNMFYVDCYR